jgi:hypothetical protein
MDLLAVALLKVELLCSDRGSVTLKLSQPESVSNFKKQLSAYIRVVTKRQPAARGLTVYPDDTFLVSFPRSGNTWTRFLVCNLINPDDPVGFAQLESRIPEIYDTPDRHLRAFPRPRIIKSHECFDPRYKKIIYIVRDPRDVFLSYYEFQLKRRVISDECSMEQFLPYFMESKFGEIMSSVGSRRAAARRVSCCCATKRCSPTRTRKVRRSHRSLASIPAPSVSPARWP